MGIFQFFKFKIFFGRIWELNYEIIFMNLLLTFIIHNCLTQIFYETLNYHINKKNMDIN